MALADASVVFSSLAPHASYEFQPRGGVDGLIWIEVNVGVCVQVPHDFKKRDASLPAGYLTMRGERMMKVRALIQRFRATTAVTRCTESAHHLQFAESRSDKVNLKTHCRIQHG